MKSKDILLETSRWVKLDKEGNPTNTVKEFYEIETQEIKAQDESKALEEYLGIVLNVSEGKRNPKKIKVIRYILDNVDEHRLTLLVTGQELADICEVSKPTALDTLKFMESLGLINRRSGGLTFVPERAKELAEASRQVKIYLTK